jgi:phosphofructokinase-like protein
MHIAVLTGGGDCPGLNAVIRAVTRTCATRYGCTMTGVLNGWRGLVDRETMPLNRSVVSGLLPQGGTILGTSRTNPFKEEEGVERILQNVHNLGIDAIVAIGGEDTLGVAKRLHEEHGVHVVGVPKTIDNDLNGTDYTFGFDTAVHIATQAIDRLHSTAESHNRIMVVEVMGRNTGWIAVMAGIAGGADAILIPEFPMTIEEMCDLMRRRMDRGKHFAIIVVSEGARIVWQSGDEETILATAETDAFGHARFGGVGTAVAKVLEESLKIETRVTTLGYVQRGGSPTSRDRILATRFGVKAAEMVQEYQWGMMAALKGDRIEAIPLADALASTKLVPLELYQVARTFFG